MISKGLQISKNGIPDKEKNYYSIKNNINLILVLIGCYEFVTVNGFNYLC